MNRKKAQKEKPYKPLYSNLFWAFRNQWEYSRSMPFLFALQLPVNLWLSYTAIRLPSLVVAQVETKASPRAALLAVGSAMLSIFLCEVLKSLTESLLENSTLLLRARTGQLLDRKGLALFYQSYERKEMRDKQSNAYHALSLWNGVQPLTDLSRNAWQFAEGILCYCLFGTVISFVSPWLVLLLTLSPAINWLSMKKFRKWRQTKRMEEADIQNRTEYVNEIPNNFSTAKDIRIYGMTGWIADHIRQVSKEDETIGRQICGNWFLAGIPDFVVTLLRDAAAYAVLIFLALKGSITVERFVLCFAAISSFADWIGKILNSWNEMNIASLPVGSLREYLDYPDSDGTGEADADKFLSSAPEITFDHVSFRYDGADEDTLKDICLTIRPGEKVALVGLNGVGKTTLVKLLCGLYRPSSGEIRINSTPLQHFKRNDYYRLLSPVFQDVKTAFYSLAEVVSGKVLEETDQERVRHCLQEAGLEEKLASLPNGILTTLDKQFNPDGTELSGGELQKLMLARALYKDAPILVLDEPTAALDPISENEIYLEYHRMAAKKTSLFISHRLASTRFCDRILYLKDGRIAEEGTLEELILAGGEYAKLYEMQSCWYRDGTEEENKEAMPFAPQNKDAIQEILM